jgi:hypothetical protein
MFWCAPLIRRPLNKATPQSRGTGNFLAGATRPTAFRGNYNRTPGKSYEQFYRGFFEDQRTVAAFLAICLRRLAESFSALAFPPFSPPSRPRDTAAGFFAGTTWEASPAILATIPAAIWFSSWGLLDRFRTA